MANEKKLLLYAGLGLAAYLLYKKYKTSAPAVSPQTQTASPAQVDPVTEYPVATLQEGTTSPLDSGGGIVIPSGIDPQVYGVVLNWLQADGDPKMSVMGVNPDPKEFAGLYNIIANNLWGNPSVLTFWNNLYNKYHSM